MSQIIVDYTPGGRYLATAIAMGLIGIGSLFYLWIEDSNNSNEKILERKVINHIDKDSNGLSFKENYEIKELMGIQDSSKNYIPNYEDWKRAYEKVYGKDN